MKNNPAIISFQLFCIVTAAACASIFYRYFDLKLCLVSYSFTKALSPNNGIIEFPGYAYTLFPIVFGLSIISSSISILYVTKGSTKRLQPVFSVNKYLNWFLMAFVLLFGVVEFIIPLFGPLIIGRGYGCVV